MNVFFNLREDCMCTLHDITCMLTSITVQNFESTVQDLETKGNPVILTAFFYRIFSNRNTHLK